MKRISDYERCIIILRHMVKVKKTQTPQDICDATGVEWFDCTDALDILTNKIFMVQVTHRTMGLARRCRLHPTLSGNHWLKEYGERMAYVKFVTNLENDLAKAQSQIRAIRQAVGNVSSS